MCAPLRRTRTRGHNTAAAHCVKITIFYESNKFLLYVIAFSIATVPYLEVWLKKSGLAGRGLVWPPVRGISCISASPYISWCREGQFGWGVLSICVSAWCIEITVDDGPVQEVTQLLIIGKLI